MGFNISGFAIDRNYIEEIDMLQGYLKCYLEFEQEVLFETAAENWKEKRTCDIFFSDKGTIVFTDMDTKLHFQGIEGQKTMAFYISDGSDNYAFTYFDGTEPIRTVREVEGKRTSRGEKLAVEEKPKMKDIIWDQLELIIGRNFWSIEPKERAYRYKVSFKAKNPDEDPLKYDPKPIEDLEVKPWWKFW
jgi:hypothetical protein